MRTTMALWIGLLAVALVWTNTARAKGAGVQDTAGLFSHDAVATAQQQIASIATRFGKDLRIETYAHIPQALADQYTPDKKQVFFANWAYQRGQAVGVDGVLVLICQAPAFLQVAVGERTQQQAFTLADRDHLRDMLVAAFRQKHYDEGLRQAVAFYGQTLQAHLGTPGTPRSPSATASPVPRSSPNVPAVAPRQTPPGASPLLWAVLLLVGLGLCLWWVRSRRGERGDYSSPPPSPGYPPPDSRYGGGYAGGYGGGYGGGAGGGFGRGFGAGLLGGLLGGWLGNRLGRHDPSPPTDASAWPSPGASEGGGSFGPAGEPDFAGQGPRDVGGGGDFGGDSDSGGGGDLGDGSDSDGGGDFGGYSDSGGGGEIREEQ